MLIRLTSAVLAFGSGFMAATLIANPSSGYAALYVLAAVAFAAGSMASRRA